MTDLAALREALDGRGDAFGMRPSTMIDWRNISAFREASMRRVVIHRFGDFLRVTIGAFVPGLPSKAAPVSLSPRTAEMLPSVTPAMPHRSCPRHAISA